MKFDLEKSKRYRSKVFRIFTASLVIVSVAAEAGALAAGVYGGNRIINNFYKLMDEYLFIANDHCPEDQIPGQ